MRSSKQTTTNPTLTLSHYPALSRYLRKPLPAEAASRLRVYASTCLRVRQSLMGDSPAPTTDREEPVRWTGFPA
ncbi:MULTISPECIES: hypothetical protein [Fischerella]|uniref:hypothetical protein n=1 Tax=Fischerella TaxID=1190 RepID=UPI0012FC98D9|nr:MULTISPECIES: hypothetical protein [Fischerella]MBD2434007.1 hypothetical protein [Fischerella sp. FACHB-380]